MYGNNGGWMSDGGGGGSVAIMVAAMNIIEAHWEGHNYDGGNNCDGDAFRGDGEDSGVVVAAMRMKGMQKIGLRVIGHSIVICDRGHGEGNGGKEDTNAMTIEEGRNEGKEGRTNRWKEEKKEGAGRMVEIN
jgi:hypothetical protein